jgi:hypothetical protein
MQSRHAKRIRRSPCYTKVDLPGICRGVLVVEKSAQHFSRVPAPWAGTQLDGVEEAAGRTGVEGDRLETRAVEIAHLAGLGHIRDSGRRTRDVSGAERGQQASEPQRADDEGGCETGLNGPEGHAPAARQGDRALEALERGVTQALRRSDQPAVVAPAAGALVEVRPKQSVLELRQLAVNGKRSVFARALTTS